MGEDGDASIGNVKGFEIGAREYRRLHLGLVLVTNTRYRGEGVVHIVRSRCHGE